MSSECPCGRPTRDGAYVCEDCLDGLSKALGNGAWLDDELTTTISKQRAATTDGEGGVSAEKALPYNVDVSEVRDNLRNTLVGWVRVCHEEAVRSSDPRGGLPADTITAMTRWLLWRVDGLAYHQAGHEACDEIAYAVSQATKAIDRPAERQYVGPCACGRDLYRKPGKPTVTCRRCETTYNAEALTDSLRDQVMGRLVTAREGATLLSRFDLSTKQATIDKWRERALVVERGHDAKGKRLYLFDELLTLAARHAPPREMDAQTAAVG